MHYAALATDYDGTLARHGAVDQATLAALARFHHSGHHLLLVTGRELADLQRVFPQVRLFHRVIAENGALLFDPGSGEETVLCPPVSPLLVHRLREQGIPVSTGRVIVAAAREHEAAVRCVVEQTGLGLQIILNKGSLMVIPAGINKATGLRRALAQLQISPDAVVGIGDAENDADFLRVCGCAVAVANALPAIKSEADLVTAGAHGAGVAEVVERLLAGNLTACGGSNRDLRPAFPD